MLLLVLEPLISNSCPTGTDKDLPTVPMLSHDCAKCLQTVNTVQVCDRTTAHTRIRMQVSEDLCACSE